MSQSLCEECDAAPVAFICMECQQNQCANCESKIHKKGNRIFHKRSPLGKEVTPVRLGVDTSSSTSPPAPISPTRSSSSSITPVKASPFSPGKSAPPFPGVMGSFSGTSGPPFPGVGSRPMFNSSMPQPPSPLPHSHAPPTSPTPPSTRPPSTTESQSRPVAASVSVLPTPPPQPPPSFVTPTPPPQPPPQTQPQPPSSHPTSPPSSHPTSPPSSHPTSPPSSYPTSPPSGTVIGVGLPGLARPRGSSKVVIAPPPPPDEETFLPPPPELSPRKSTILGVQESGGRTSPEKKHPSEPEGIKPFAAKQQGFTPISTPSSHTRVLAPGISEALPTGFTSVPAPPSAPPGEDDDLPDPVSSDNSLLPPPPPEYEDEESDDDGMQPPPPEVEFGDGGSSAAMGIFQHSMMESSRSYVIPSFLPPPEDYSDSSDASRTGAASVSVTRAPTISTINIGTSGGGRGLIRATTDIGPITPQKASIDPKASMAKKVGSSSKADAKSICASQDKCMSFAARSGYCLRHIWKSYDKTPEPSTQEKVAREIITTERSYQQGLGVAVRRFLKGLLAANEFERSIIPQETITQIFHNIEDIYALSTEMCVDLEEIKYKPFLCKQIGLTLLHYSHRFKIYQTYLENYDSAIQRLTKVREENPQFDFFLKINEKAEDNMALQSFLIMPIQRLPRYLLLLKELIKNTPESDPDLADMNLAHTKIKQIADYINNCLHLKAASDKVRVLEDMFEKDDRFVSLAHPRRFLIKQGPLNKRFSKKSLHLGSAKAYIFFLFNDILVYASASKFGKSGGKGSYQMKNVLPISDMKVKEISNPKQKTKDIQIKVKKREYILSAEDLKSHNEWMEALSTALSKFQQSESSLAGGESSKKLQSVMLGQKS